jgi:DNA-binding MarR family transcriptional regulator
MDLESQRDLKVLEAIAQEQRITQRSLAANLGIALGLANLYVKRLVRKGYIKCVNIQSNRILYLITPKGIAEKTRLTFEYIEYSFHLYRQVRAQLRAVLQPLQRAGHQRIAIYGTGDVAELAYLSVKEAGLDVAAIFDGAGGQMFLGMPVLDIRDQQVVAFDLLIIAVLDPPEAIINRLVSYGVPGAKVRSVRPLAPSQSVSGSVTAGRT